MNALSFDFGSFAPYAQDERGYRCIAPYRSS